MSKAFIIHWNREEALEKINSLKSEGWQVQYEHEDGGRGFKAIKENPPDIVIIYLSRLPSHGRSVAETLKMTKSTRNIPIIFVDGKPDKIEIVKDKIPDAIYTTSDKLIDTLEKYR